MHHPAVAIRTNFRRLSPWRSVALLAGGLSTLAAAPQQAPAPTPAADQQALVKRYCTGCHNAKVKTGGVALDNVDASNVAGHAGVWEAVLRKMRNGQMPPPGLPRPPAATYDSFTKWLEAELDRSAIEHPNPGRPTIHRLNRAEYSNAVRDLLALDINVGSQLPTDDTGYGFDNIGDVLSMSPTLLERYISVARRVSRLAVGDPGPKPDVAEYVLPKDPSRGGARFERVSDDLPFGSAGGMQVTHRFPVDGEYVLRFKVTGPGTADGPGIPTIEEVRLPVKAGTRTVAVTFLKDSALPEVVATPARRGGATRPPTPTGPTTQPLDLRLDGARVKLYDVPRGANPPTLVNISVTGPYQSSGPGQTASREQIFLCHATSAREEEPCARKILNSLARRAYRRSVTDADIRPLLTFYRTGRQEGDFERGIETALRAMLISPNFLFRIEHDPANAAAGASRVNDFELASRLSFFLWSSIPDDALLKLAEQNKLHDPAVLSQQVDRLLADHRSQALVTNFAGQWLFLRNLTQVKPDPDEFPDFNTSLGRAFRRETELFFNAILRENRPVTELLDANFTYLNQQLAEHYGVTGIYGPQFRRVTLKDPNRGGLLGQGSILTVTSYPNRTSVVQRGKWVLENLLGAPPPPPPPDIPALAEHSKEGTRLTMRQQMEQHRSNPTCASCHSRMDPIGFSLENYNGIGKWRAKDAGAVIDASGKLPDGTVFEGPAGLKKLLLTAHRDEFLTTVTEKLMTYALGRGLEPYDRPTLRGILREAAPQNTTFPALIHAIVKSPQFQMRRTRES